VFLCVVLCDPLCLSILQLNTKDTKVGTKAHKGLFEQPHTFSKLHIYNSTISLTAMALTPSWVWQALPEGDQLNLLRVTP
jgi:hypothetical protein